MSTVTTRARTATCIEESTFAREIRSGGGCSTTTRPKHSGKSKRQTPHPFVGMWLDGTPTEDEYGNPIPILRMRIVMESPELLLVLKWKMICWMCQLPQQQHQLHLKRFFRRTTPPPPPPSAARTTTGTPAAAATPPPAATT
eukprot:14942280-Ditylum_brightwellii.AAC.1